MSLPFLPHSGSFIVPAMGPSPEYIADLQRRKAVITRLCTALHEFLTLDIDSQLERASRPPQQFQRPKPTIEDLEQAQRQVEQIQRQIEALENAADSMPEEIGGYLEELQKPMLESQLQGAQNWLSTIQQAMEATDAPPAQEPAA